MVRISFLFVPRNQLITCLYIILFLSFWKSVLWDFIVYTSLSYIVIVLLFLCRYKSLEVKNILLETVSHHILPQMLASPLWSDSTDILRDYLRFMDDHFRESADLTFLAYRHRSYSKVSDLQISYLWRLQF